MLPMTKTEIAKMAVQMVVSMKVTQIAEDQIVQHTDADPDGLPVKVGSAVIGWSVAYKLKPQTDKAVDAVITRYQSWRESKKTSE